MTTPQPCSLSGSCSKTADPIEARRWYERAAANDHAGAMFNLGFLLKDSGPRRGQALVAAGSGSGQRQRVLPVTGMYGISAGIRATFSLSG